ncbi:MobA/MobL family protein [uncultured Psychrobacter sp.]|uniref:MobA/MobL family protein n=1 Tax=uncultured Psychrobacter sp. TaxID=259303 RepID=UPI0026090F13|nr:MobA/MobL family protein [uncultured Psychrobacter sp.]
MAIFIASTKSISRGSGQSAVASASYRSGEVLKDERYGKTHDYSKRSGVMSADIILPSALADTDVTIDRSDLWNKAESAEKRKDARVAREWLVNLPHELSEQDRKDIAHRFAQTLADRYGTIADCAIHKPTQKEIDRGADPRNFHAHIMFTTRTAKLNDNNEIVLTDKATIELSDNKRRELGMERVNVEIKEVRQLWEQIANEKLAEYDHELIDSRSYADQGKDIEPQLKMGSVATKIERDAYETAKAAAEEKGEVFNGIAPVTIRGEINAMIAERNRLVLEASNRIIFEQRDYDERLETTKRYINRADQRIRNTKRQIERTEQDIEWSSKRCKNLPNWINGNHEAIESNTKRYSGTAQANEKLTQRIDNTKQSIKSITEAIGRSNIEINSAVEQSARPAPSPFDDNYSRAFYERKRRIDRELREYDRQAKRESYADEKENNDLRATLNAFAHRLMTRHHEKFSLRPGFRDNPADYPEKFDYRQIKVLDRFANELGLTNDFDSFREEQQRIADLFTFDVMQDNLNAMDILINRQKERKNYHEVTADFDAFITSLDASRTAKNNELQGPLGRSDISRMTAETLTAVSYLDNIEQYINKETTANECKILAQEHISDILKRTSIQYELAYQGLRTLDSNESVQKHARALESSLSGFNTKYADKLTESDIKSINNGLEVLSQKLEITRPINRPSPSPF